MNQSDKVFLVLYFTVYALFISLDIAVFRLMGMVGIILFQVLSIVLKKSTLTLNLKAIIFLLLIIIIPYIRSFFSGVVGLNFVILNIIYFSVFLFYLQILTQRSKWNQVFYHLRLSLYLLIVVNLSMFFLGIGLRTIEPEEAVMWRIFGVHVNRVFFPLSPGINAMGSLAGLTFMLILYDLKLKNLPKLLSLSIGICTFLVIMYSDSRGSILSIIIVSIIMIFSLEKIFFKLIYVQPFFIFIALGILFYLMTSVESEMLSEIMRGRFILSGREVIWVSALNRIVSDPFHLFFGFGYLGQTISQVYQDYYFIFGYHRNPETMSLHNYVLQYIFDCGLIGLYYTLFVIHQSYKNSESRIETVFLIFVLILGMLEVSISIYSFYIFCFLLCFLLKPNFKDTRKEQNTIALK
ncbi:MAG: O-antigen ligase family protein [bacterium]|nr:O-antigen ligase family protein [bacterium]